MRTKSILTEAKQISRAVAPVDTELIVIRVQTPALAIPTHEQPEHRCVATTGKNALVPGRIAGKPLG